jgi:hypothetical protein
MTVRHLYLASSNFYSFAPIEVFALSRCSRVHQVCANCRFDEVTPVFAISFGFLQAIARLRCHQHRVEDLKLGAGPPLPDRFPGILLQTTVGAVSTLS